MFNRINLNVPRAFELCFPGFILRLLREGMSFLCIQLSQLARGPDRSKRAVNVCGPPETMPRSGSGGGLAERKGVLRGAALPLESETLTEVLVGPLAGSVRQGRLRPPFLAHSSVKWDNCSLGMEHRKIKSPSRPCFTRSTHSMPASLIMMLYFVSTGAKTPVFPSQPCHV